MFLVGLPLFTKTTAAGPTIVTSAVYNPGSNVDPIVATLPTGLVNGNKLGVALIIGGAAVITTPSGYTLKATYGTGGSFDRKIYYFEKVIDGSEGSTVTIDQTSSNSGSLVYSFQISGSSSATLLAGTNGTSVDVDPPNNNPGSSAFTLWITIASKRQTSNLSAVPAGYTILQSFQLNNNLAGGAAYKTSTATSEDPGVFAGTGSDTWAAATLGFRA